MPRHKEYAPEEVLDKATQLFWRQGYEATSMQDLVDHLGINRFSIYDTFGSKHKLFLAAIDHYRNVYAAGLRATLEDESKGLQAIRDYFAMMESELSKAGGRVGCLVQNSTLECVLTDGDVETRIQETNLSFVRAIRAALRRAEKMGEIEEAATLPRAPGCCSRSARACSSSAKDMRTGKCCAISQNRLAHCLRTGKGNFLRYNGTYV